MKPKPFLLLNHFTLPLAITVFDVQGPPKEKATQLLQVMSLNYFLKWLMPRFFNFVFKTNLIYWTGRFFTKSAQGQAFLFKNKGFILRMLHFYDCNFNSINISISRKHVSDSQTSLHTALLRRS